MFFLKYIIFTKRQTPCAFMTNEISSSALIRNKLNGRVVYGALHSFLIPHCVLLVLQQDNMNYRRWTRRHSCTSYSVSSRLSASPLSCSALLYSHLCLARKWYCGSVCRDKRRRSSFALATLLPMKVSWTRCIYCSCYLAAKREEHSGEWEKSEERRRPLGHCACCEWERKAPSHSPWERTASAVV